MKSLFANMQPKEKSLRSGSEGSGDSIRKLLTGGLVENQKNRMNFAFEKFIKKEIKLQISLVFQIDYE